MCVKSLKVQRQLELIDKKRGAVVWQEYSQEAVVQDAPIEFKRHPAFTTIIFEPSEKIRADYVWCCETMGIRFTIADSIEALVSSVKQTLEANLLLDLVFINLNECNS